MSTRWSTCRSCTRNSTQWTDAYDTRQRLTKLAATDSQPQSQAILAFLENEIGLEAMRRKDYGEATRRFQAAIELDARAVPAYLNLGDVRMAQDNEKGAAAIWDALVQVAPDRAYLAFDRIETLAVRSGSAGAIHAPLSASHRGQSAGLAREARPVAPPRRRAAGRRKRSTCSSPRSSRIRTRSSIHQAIWRALGQLRHPTSLVDRYGELTQHAVFYLDPHVCMRCRYRSTELLWQCPHCHDWNTFVEERIAPAQDTAEVEA